MKLFNGNDIRSNKIYKNVAISFLLKVMATIILFAMVPLTLTCLGSYQNGVWLTISSLLVWIDQMDIGLGNGLRNKLSICIAHQRIGEARKIISSCMAMLTCIIVPLAILLLILIQITDVYAFFNVEPGSIPTLRRALQAAVIFVCMTFNFKLIGNVYMGMQIPAANNLIIVIGQSLSLTITWLLFKMGHATFLNVVIANTAAPMLIYVIAYPITFYKVFPALRPSINLINLSSALSLGNLGIRFFWLQIAGVIQMMTANILISNLFSPEIVTPYQIAYRYFSIVLAAFTVICVPFWNATTDAFERNDIQWIRMADKRMSIVVIILGVCIVLMVAISPLIYNLWIGNKCEVPFGITLMVAIYTFIIIASSRYSYFLNGIGALRLQMYMTVTVIVFIPLAWLTSRLIHDINYFLAVMCLCIAPSWIVNKIQFYKILNGKATGIWKK